MRKRIIFVSEVSDDKLHQPMRRTIVTLFILFFCAITFAQSPQYYYKQLPLDDISSVITDIHSSKGMGIIWIGTTNGLIRFDGTYKKKYEHKRNDLHSLPHNHIRHILEDKNEDVWIFTAQGLAKYSYKFDNFSIPLFENKPIKAYSSCKTDDGFIIGANNQIFKYSYKTCEFTLIFEFKDRNFDFHNISLIDHNKILGSNKWKGLVVIDLTTKQTDNNPFSNKSNHPTITYIDSQQNIWISDFNEGLRCYTPNKKLIKHYTTSNSQLNNNIILCIKEINHKIWVGTDGGGINIINPITDEIEILQHVSGNTHSLPFNTITCLSSSENNSIWAGSTRRGFINIRKVPITTYSEVVLRNNMGLSERSILSMWHTPSDSLVWLGTDGGGVNSFNVNNHSFRHFTNTWGSKVVSMCDLSKDKLIISLFSKGIFIFNKHTGHEQEIRFDHKDLIQSIYYSGKSVNLARYKTNSILLLGNRIYKFNIQTHQLDTITYAKGVSTGETLFFIAETGNCIYLNDQHSIYMLDKDEEILYKILSVPFHVNFYSVGIDSHGTFWIGSNEGLSFWKKEDKERTPVPTSLFKKVTSVLCDKKDNLWLGADQKLFTYLPEKNRFIMFGESDGATPNAYLNSAKTLLTKNEILMGGINGLQYISLYKGPHATDSLSRIHLIDFSINGENKIQYIQNKRITISWNSKNIRLRTIIHDNDILRNKLYRYSINKHIYESFNPELFIPSLQPGEYTIQLSYSLIDGNFSPRYKLLTITILPPWYTTWWFILLCIFLIISFIAVFFIYSLKRKENKMKWLMKEHEQKIYEDKVRFLINISHELRTPLTLIYAPLKRILKTMAHDNENYNALMKIYKQSGRMRELINMVLDIRKMETGANTLTYKLYDFNEWMSEVCEDFKDECAIQKVKLVIRKDNRIPEAAFDKGKCTIILTNLLSNALKHSPEQTQLTVSSQLNEDKKMIRITVTDQGKGLGTQDTSKFFERFYQGESEKGGTGIGLAYSKVLVEQHHGHIGAFSNPEGEGASFFFEIPFCLQESVSTYQPKAYINELFDTHAEDNDKEMVRPEKLLLNHIKILFVDDNVNLTEFIFEQFKDTFKEVVTANSAEEALHKLENYMPDIIISDIMMPGMNGLELCKTIKQNLSVSHIPVILLTARTDEQSKNLGYKIGADAYLSKPFDTELLVNCIDNLIYNRRKLKEHYQSYGIIPEPIKETFSQADEAFLQKLNKVINDNLDNSLLDINFICSEIGISRTSLYTKMKALTDMGANDYINKLRLEKAITLIKSNKFSVNDISTMVGFSTPRYFSTAFKQYTGMTPTQFKSQNNQNI